VLEGSLLEFLCSAGVTAVCAEQAAPPVGNESAGMKRRNLIAGMRGALRFAAYSARLIQRISRRGGDPVL